MILLVTSSAASLSLANQRAIGRGDALPLVCEV
jgi:hypothetical protein